MPTSPGMAFALLLLALIAWMALPLLPAFMELLRPRDAAPLSAVGNDAGKLTYFADSFTKRRSPASSRMRIWRCRTSSRPCSCRREKVRLTVSSLSPR